MEVVQLLPQLGVAGGVIAAVVLLLREVKSLKSAPPSMRVIPVKTETKLDAVDSKIQNQQVQLDCLSKEQAETRAIVERQGGKLDTILEIVKRQ
tara:strand:+ start:610 stop:891 length:282 start_codon:yes stop_codon:yes gene_type:complete